MDIAVIPFDDVPRFHKRMLSRGVALKIPNFMFAWRKARDLRIMNPGIGLDRWRDPQKII